MAYSDRDAAIAPPSPPSQEVDFQTLCDMVDGSQDVPVAYAFGGAAPTTVSLGDGSTTLEEVVMSPLTGYRRMFVEFYPHGWNPASPTYTGG